MSNPFSDPGLFMAEIERRRRERFKLGVYAMLGTLFLVVTGLLIQGCRNSQTTAESTGDTPSEPPAVTNLVASTEAAPETSAAPAPVTPPTQVTAAPQEPAPALTSGPAQPAPVMQAPAPQAAQLIYVVKKGDTLTRIARTHATTIEAIKTANGLSSDRIVAGAKLKLPQKGRESTATHQT